MARTNANDVTERLMKIVRGGLPRKARKQALEPEQNLRKLGLDSLAVVLIVTRFCEEFEIDITTLDGNIGELHTIGDLMDAGHAIVASLDASSEP